MNLEFTILSIKMCQILSRAYKRLSSARALRQSAKELITAVSELDEEVNVLKRSVEHIIMFDEPLDSLSTPLCMSFYHIVILYFLYYSLVLEIHGPLMLPWSEASSRQFQPFQPQVERSCSIVAQIARAAILGSRFIQLDANSLVM